MFFLELFQLFIIVLPFLFPFGRNFEGCITYFPLELYLLQGFHFHLGDRTLPFAIAYISYPFSQFRIFFVFEWDIAIAHFMLVIDQTGEEFVKIVLDGWFGVPFKTNQIQAFYLIGIQFGTDSFATMMVHPCRQGCIGRIVIGDIAIPTDEQRK